MIVKYPSVIQKLGESVWITYAKKQTTTRNSSVNAVITGQPGTGKSYSAISYLYNYDPKGFTIDRIYFKGSDLLRDINSGKLEKGTPILFDEAGCDLSSKEWQSTINKAFSLIFQTLRHRNYVIVMTLPYLTMLSKDVRTLLTVHFETAGWTEDKLCRVKAFGLEYNNQMDKFFRKRMFVRTKGQRGCFCNETRFPLAPKELLDQYETKKKAFLNELYGNLQKKLEAHERKQTDDALKSSNLGLTAHQDEILDYLKDGLSMEEISDTLKIGHSSLYGTLQSIKKKGISIKGIRNDDKKVTHYEIIDPRNKAP